MTTNPLLVALINAKVDEIVSYFAKAADGDAETLLLALEEAAERLADHLGGARAELARKEGQG